MFFDRAMYVSLLSQYSRKMILINPPGLQWEMCVFPELEIKITNLQYIAIDTLFNRPNHYNRTPKDDVILRAETKT